MLSVEAKMDIVVLCGGLSAERDVSVTSGTMVTAALRRRGHRAVPVDLFFGWPHPYDDPRDIFELEYDGAVAAVAEKVPDIGAVKAGRTQAGDSRMGDNILEVCRAADIVFLALHGEDGEDGKIQAVFDLTGIKYTGTGHLGSAVAMNKALSKQLFEQNGIRTPKGVHIKKGSGPYIDPGFPCVVKPRSRGSSVGVSVVHAPEDYPAALELAFRYDDDVIAERYIKGRECDVGILAGRALPVIEICPKSGFYDYKNKYQAGLTDEYCPADLPPGIAEKLQRVAERVYEVLMFDVYGRMDFIVDEAGDVWCLEGNTLPGLTPISLLPQEAAAAGLSYEDLCEAIIAESFKKYER
jgi:D-alanine-D-alanine ligase